MKFAAQKYITYTITIFILLCAGQSIFFERTCIRCFSLCMRRFQK
jgi:hypothetical protein